MRFSRPLSVTLSLGCLALFGTAAWAGIPSCPMPVNSISDVQMNADPNGTWPSACDGVAVSLEGIVYAVYSGSSRGFGFADAAGEWNGIWVFAHGGLTLPEVGDEVAVSGTVDEFFGVTEIVASGISEVSTGKTPYPASVISTLTAATSESYEGVFVEVQNVDVTNENPDDPSNFNEFVVDDGSGGVRVDDYGTYCYLATLGDELDVVRGMLHYSFGNYKIQPRFDCDFVLGACTPALPVPKTTSQLQGSGFTSPEAGTLVQTTGVVTGLFEGNYPGFSFFDGFFVQDPVGDGDAATSDGLFVISNTIPTIGNEVTVEGCVREFNEFDRTACVDDCVTTVTALSVTDNGAAGTPITAETWAPPSDPDGLYEFHESREGMLVEIPGTANVVGPTDFGAVFVIDDAEGVDRVLRGTAAQGKEVGVRNWETFGDINGSDPADLIVGGKIVNVIGPLTSSFTDPLVITQAALPWAAQLAPGLPAPSTWSPVPTDRFTVATFNVENLDDGDTTKIAKLAESVGLMNCPTFLALQEVDTVSTIAGQEDEVLSEIETALAGEGCNYTSANSHPDLGDHGVAVLWSTDRVASASFHTDLQGCSPDGSTSSPAYDAFCDAVPGEFPLFSRRPVVLTALLDAPCPGSSPLEIVLIANHFKSKLGGASADQRRLEQGQLIASAVDDLLLAGNDHVLVLGDLNDFETAPPVTAMTTDGPLLNLWDNVAPNNRYSYIFSGVSQILDHQLATPDLDQERIAIAPLHYNADYPQNALGDDETTPWALSDHDPVLATFGACLSGVIFADGFESGDITAW